MSFNFEQRAQKALDRGQPVRSAVLLIEGLKRQPDERAALDFLIDLYVDELTSAGLEYDLTGVLVLQSDSEQLFRDILRRLDPAGKASMGRELVRAANEHGYDLTWPPAPEPAPAPTAEPMPEPRPPAQTEPYSSPEPELEPAITEPTPEPEPERAPVELQPEPEPVDRALETNMEPEPAPERQTPETKEHNPPPAAASKRKGRLLLVVLVLVAGLGGYVWWSSGPDTSSVAALDASIESVDPAQQTQIDELFAATSKRDLASPAFAERRAFLEAVRAAEWGEASASAPGGETVWGIAAKAASFALQRDFERALAESARLERQFPHQFASFWARAFVAEARGRFATAVRLYGRGHEAAPEFAPMLTGQLRVLVRQGRQDEARTVRQKLANLNRANPYASMPVVDIALEDMAPGEPDEATDQPGEKTGQPNENNGQKEQLENASPKPRFIHSVESLERALDLIRQDKPRDALGHVDKALEREPMLGGALLVAGMLRVAAVDIDGGVASFTSLAQLPGLDMNARWLLQVVAPRALTAAGRADLAYQFVPPVKDAGRVTPRDSSDKGKPLPEPVVPLLSVEEQVQTEPLAREALLARAEVLSVLGFGVAATETLELLGGIDDVADRVGFERTIVEIRRGNRSAARGAARALPESAPGHSARAALAYHTGRYANAIEHARAALEAHKGAGDVTTLRYLALSLTASGRGRAALVALDEAQVAAYARAELDALRMRVLGRRGPKAESSTTSYETFAATSPTSLERLLDLADVAFWHKRFEQSREWTDQALALAPEHPEANWMRGLHAQVAGDDKTARAHFRDAWRSGADDARMLIELGRIYLSLGEPKRAQRSFYKALLKDRTSVEALRGLGEAYLELDARVGRRDMARILRSYAGSSAFTAQATETLKWLAILNGSRKGNEKGLAYLTKAAELMGESATLLIERAHYHKARGEFALARKMYAKALEKNGTLAPARLGLARMALEGGDEALARTQLQRYLALAPDGDDAQWARDTLANLTTPSNSASE
ncbi:tetratricopeptide repeat protein [Persicimonas caeni]|uniref:Tetratricopeptide repeat protein n=1 Tax=Persicimonas caeni TaxID=2292766 RepID=A0A4Y6Q193_PERCE|nr:tetratricopeptide repeat protein [Persicimonas caeni]QDG54348.1 tetratricopeptide repeat protein [Persicimonas caeni]QED35569.1 tetratricopeptide repeat protein [Persicimonas caeni]